MIIVQWLGKNKNEWVFEPRSYKNYKIANIGQWHGAPDRYGIAGHGPAVIALKYLLIMDIQ